MRTISLKHHNASNIHWNTGTSPPGAIALISAPADNIWGGDSRYWVPPMFGFGSQPASPNPPPTGMPYDRPEDLDDPLVSPALSPALLGRFPPTP